VGSYPEAAQTHCRPTNDPLRQPRPSSTAVTTPSPPWPLTPPRQRPHRRLRHDHIRQLPPTTSQTPRHPQVRYPPPSGCLQTSLHLRRPTCRPRTKREREVQGASLVAYLTHDSTRWARAGSAEGRHLHRRAQDAVHLLVHLRAAQSERTGTKSLVAVPPAGLEPAAYGLGSACIKRLTCTVRFTLRFAAPLAQLRWLETPSTSASHAPGRTRTCGLPLRRP
jgi:hypothetical protein